MYRYLIKVISILQCCNALAYSTSINTKLLDQEAEACLSRLWAHNPINEAYIQKSLNFLYKEDENQEKYRNGERFMALVEHIQNSIEDPTFLSFSKVCQTIFDQQNNLNKIAVHMLLKEVEKKYSRLDKIGKQQRSRNVNSKEKSRPIDIAKIDKNYCLPQIDNKTLSF